jgi:hypothetical protein
MRKHGGNIPMKEIENSIVNVSSFNPKFIDTISQIIGFWTAKFVPKCS